MCVQHQYIAYSSGDNNIDIHKLGSAYIPGDKKPMSKNGRLLAKVIEENDLIVVNGTAKCDGVITRYRKTINGVEESVIDFFIVCRQFFNLVNSLYIDEKRIFPLTKFSTKNGKKSIKDSDHNILEFRLFYLGKLLAQRGEWHYELRDTSELTELIDSLLTTY